MLKRYRWWLFISGWIMVVFPALALGLTLMPIIPSMQEWDSIRFSYYVYQAQYALVGLGSILMAVGAINAWPSTRWWWRMFMVVMTVIAIGIHVLSRTEASAEEMFNEPLSVVRINADPEGILADTTIYLWVERNGQIAGYPVDLVAHHHKIHDTIGGVPVLVTYCTMCHTGRVFSPIIDGIVESFRLVGANHFNAIFEDNTTGSWWYQATGECVVGPRTGLTFSDIPFTQGTATEMLAVTQSRSVSVFVPDLETGDRYSWSRGYASRVGDTTQALARKSIVIGISVGSNARAYPMHDLIHNRNGETVLRDTINGTALAFTRPRTFSSPVTVFKDSVNSGVLLQSYREYWHSWKHFHPTTTVWGQR